MWINPCKVSDKLFAFARNLDCDWLGAVDIIPDAAYDYDNCHNNVQTHVSIYGGKPVIGWYFVEGFDTVQAIRHTVWGGEQLIDITPYKDKREHIIFARSADQCIDYRIPNCYIQSLDKYFSINLEGQKNMYYVYQLVDPQNNQPFYIGKGKGRRAKTHLWETPETRNVYKENKIADIRKSGSEPKIEYVAENIIDEDLAYNIETELIKKYGRKGYEKNGILTNVCIDNRPPNHKGKTYEEIYGPEKAKEQRELRSRLQKERGGYGPKKHNNETIEHYKKINAGEGNPMYGKSHSEEAKKQIGKSNSKYAGKLNKKSKKYKLTSPNGDEIILYGGEAAEYCKENNLSYSTLKMQIQKNWSVPKKGKTKGWKFEEIINKENAT